MVNLGPLPVRATPDQVSPSELQNRTNEIRATLRAEPRGKTRDKKNEEPSIRRKGKKRRERERERKKFARHSSFALSSLPPSRGAEFLTNQIARFSRCRRSARGWISFRGGARFRTIKTRPTVTRDSIGKDTRPTRLQTRNISRPLPVRIAPGAFIAIYNRYRLN